MEEKMRVAKRLRNGCWNLICPYSNFDDETIEASLDIGLCEFVNGQLIKKLLGVRRFDTFIHCTFKDTLSRQEGRYRVRET